MISHSGIKQKQINTLTERTLLPRKRENQILTH
jgi:hypothetical protein